MRTRREIYAVVTVLVVCVLVVLGTIWFQVGFDAAPVDVPEQHNITEDAPADVEEDPPSAVGSIDEP